MKRGWLKTTEFILLHHPSLQLLEFQAKSNLLKKKIWRALMNVETLTETLFWERFSHFWVKNLFQKVKELIIRTLQNTLTSDNLNKITAGETQLKRVFSKIVDDLGLYYKIGLTTDFTGKLFNEMYSWLGFSQDKLNDVVLTPSYVAKLLAKLARVDRNSYVWDFATGSARLLVAAMNEMLIDAKTISSRPKN